MKRLQKQSERPIGIKETETCPQGSSGLSPEGYASGETTVILRCNYEEVRALRSGARSLLEGDVSVAATVLAPSESRARVEALLPQLHGDLSLTTLHEVRAVAMAVHAIVESLRAEMEAVVLATHAADESAVASYFDFAHALTVSDRLQEMAAEMEALIELVTGQPVDADTVRSFRFPD